MSQQVLEGKSAGITTHLIISCSNRSTWVFFDRDYIFQTNPTMSMVGLTVDMPLQVVQPGRTLTSPQGVLAVRMWAEPQRSWNKPGMLVFAVLRDVLAILSTGRDWAFSRPLVRLDVLANEGMSAEWTIRLRYGWHTPTLTCPSRQRGSVGIGVRCLLQVPALPSLRPQAQPREQR